MKYYIEKKLWFFLNWLREKKYLYHYPYFTDYPVVEFGDKEGEIAGRKGCEILSYDGNKYLTIKVYGEYNHANDVQQSAIIQVKSGYVYKQYGHAYWMRYYKKDKV